MNQVGNPEKDHPAYTQEKGLLALYEIVKAVNSTLDLDEVLNLIIKETTKLFHADAGSVMLLNENSVLTIKSAQGLPGEIIKNTRVRLGEGIAGWVAKTGETLLLDGKVTDPRFKNLVDRKEEILSSICTPLKCKGKIIGVLMLRRTHFKSYTEEQRNLFSLIADQAAIAIENASLYEAEKKRSYELRRLNEILRLEKLKIETILSSMADGVVVTTPGGEIIHINRSTERMLNVNGKDIVGKHFDHLFTEECCFDEIKYTVIETDGRYKSDFSRKTDDGEMHFRLIGTVMKGKGDKPDGLVMVIQNITEMKRIDKMKSEFVSMVSHELRTPLTSVVGFAELMMNREFNPERRKRYLNIIIKDSERLMRLIDDLLDLSKLEAGKFYFKPTPFKIDEIISQVMESLKGQAPEHNLLLEITEEIPILSLDRDMFTNLISNLLSNAVKYSPDSGDIKVTLQSNEKEVSVCVSDHGIGIEAEKIPRIFDKFYRVDSSLNRKTGGTGLGLATVKYIVEEFGGKIWVESELGKGSSFIFTLPLED
ncbi:MAG: GAF domain-containing protein [Candidatus Eremiobacteraeota bacterium]|nr:GAF domain-containing protein [Candidatus Eremiobacteraeota bacterium]